MSRSKPRTGSNSPVKKYLSFAGGKGKIKFYSKDDKRANDKGHVMLDKLDLVILDVKASISGYNEKASSQISSNMLDPYSTGKEPFVVKTKVNGSYEVFAKGIWKDIKDEVGNIGGKFTTNIFALADTGNGMEVVRLELNGSALSPWIEFKDKLDDGDEYNNVITIERGQLCTRKKGMTAKVTDAEYKKIVDMIKKDPLAERPVLFYESKFSMSDLSEELADQAAEADEELQKYFDQSGNNKGQEVSSTSTDDDSVPTSPEPAEGTAEADDNDLPF